MTRWAWVLRALLWSGAWPRLLAQAPDGAATSIPPAAPPAPPGEYLIASWQTDDGLPQNTVTSIAQTPDFFLWFGTQNGLVRFDGARFTVLDANNLPELKDSRIVRLYVDRHGSLWIGTEGGGIVRLKDERATRFAIGEGASGQHLAAACEDDAGALWLYTADGQLWRYANDRFLVSYFGLGQLSTCRALVAEPPGSLWVGTDRRLSRVSQNPQPGPLEHQVLEDQPVSKLDGLLAARGGGYWCLADHRVRKFRGRQLEADLGVYGWTNLPVFALCEDRQGSLWVGTLGGGVFQYDTHGQVTHLGTSQGLSHDVIRSLFEDHEGNLWVGTEGGGVNRLKPRVFETLDQRRGLAANVVYSVCADAQGGLWVGSNGGGVDHFQDGAVQHYGPAGGLANPYVRCVYVARDQTVWAGTWGGGVFQLRDGRFQLAPGVRALNLNPVVRAIFQDRAGDLWFGTQGGLARWRAGAWTVFTTHEGLSANEVRAIAEDAAGNLWVGTIGGGLNRLAQGRFSALRQKHGLPSDDISSLYVDAEGVLWIGTLNRGLCRWQAGQLASFSTQQGLGDNSIGYILEDGQGHLWMGSAAGLLRVNKEELNALARGATNAVQCRSYGRADGLPTRECTVGGQPGAWRTADGRLWFATVKGLVSINPAQLKPSPYPPPVLIESILVDGQPQNTNLLQVRGPARLVLPYGKEQLEIRYTALNFSAPDRVRFKYRLEGYETTWVEAGPNRSARYSRLPPGHYRFQVLACNQDGVWNPTGSGLGLVIEPPFWRTWWFRCGAGAGFLAAVAGLVYYFSTVKLRRQLERARRDEAVEKERSRIARDIHDQLGASLTQVTFLSELALNDKDAPAEVEAHARQISQTARSLTRALDEIVWAANPANDTLEGLMTYVCKYAQEYLSVAGLACRLEVPAQLPSWPLSPDARHHLFLAVKEALTNIVRHAKATEAALRLLVEPSRFVLEIQDNGCGLPAAEQMAAKGRHGLDNLRQRLAEVGGHCELDSAPGRGLMVRLVVPR